MGGREKKMPRIWSVGGANSQGKNIALNRFQKNLTKTTPSINPKSRKNRDCVADGFLERFGAALGRQWSIFGAEGFKILPKWCPRSI